MPPQGPIYEWIGIFSGEEKACVSASVSAYAGFLERLRYEALHDPSVYAPAAKSRWLRLRDDAGRSDTLEVGGRDAAGNAFVRLRPAALVLTVAPEKAALLFPPVRILLDTLSGASPFQRAEPTFPSSF
jgi:hypothetical protein